MTKKLNTFEKKLKFHCSNCSANWQLLVIKTDLLTDQNTKCLNQCQDKWQALLITYCQEQIILDITRKEQAKDQKQQDLTEWLEQIRKQNDKN